MMECTNAAAAASAAAGSESGSESGSGGGPVAGGGGKSEETTKKMSVAMALMAARGAQEALFAARAAAAAKERQHHQHLQQLLSSPISKPPLAAPPLQSSPLLPNHQPAPAAAAAVASPSPSPDGGGVSAAAAAAAASGAKADESKTTTSAPTASSSSSSSSGNSGGDKKINNNTTSYVSGGGRLKFFKDNLCLLELTHRGPADGGPPGESKWIPITKKVYWPPTGTAAAAGAAASQQSHNGHQPNQPNQPLNPLLPGAKSEAGSVISAHSASDGDAATASMPGSPWPPGSAESPSAAAPPAVTGAAHRKSHPARRSSSAGSTELMFPPPCVVTLRKKVRGLKRRRRRPHDPIKVALMLIKAETNAVTTRKPKKMPAIVNHDQLLKLKNAATGEEGKVDPIMLKCMQELKDHRQAKVEDVLKKIKLMPKKPKSQGAPLVTIAPWSSSKAPNAVTSSTSAAVAAATVSINSAPPRTKPSLPPGHILTTPSGVTRVKSELCPVTETCTAATMPAASPASSSSSGRHGSHAKNKANSQHNAAAAEHARMMAVAAAAAAASNSPFPATASPLHPHHMLNSSPKTMPITPTVARIKSDPTNASPSGVLSSASLISPDLQRVKVEIGASIRPPHHHHQLPAAMAMQQLQSADQPHFISPRKRMSMENGSSPVPMKKHRLSTDSRGSGGSDGANGPHSPSAAAGHNPLSFGNRSSPLRASYPTSKSPFHHHLAASAAAAAAAASPPRAAPRSNFSIDSIISGRGEENHSSRSGSPSIRSGTPLIRPVPLPASPARVNSYGDGSRSPTPMTAIKPHPARSPPNINIMSYAERNHPAAAALSLHPHLAHLAGVSADPKLGLNPIPGSPAATASAAAAAFQPSSPYPNPPALAAVQAAQAAHAAQAAQAQAHAQAAANQSVITALYQSALLSQNPALAAQLLQHLPDGGAGSAFKQEQPPISLASMVSSSPLRTPVTHSVVTSSVMSHAGGGWSPSTPQYRGEPRIPVDTTPGAAADASNVRRDEVSPDAPLDLSTMR